MTNDRPTLFLKRLIVRGHNNGIAYDEVFHNGVNIIRGKNSSGKSTIANFIFFVLGGAYNNWTAEALKCRDVIAEITVNGAVITIRRKISDSAFESMGIYWGSYEASLKDAGNWQLYPYKMTTNLVSFTNVLFKALGFPTVKNDADANITLHQIFRLIYVDQDTPTQSLFRYERFDPPFVREAVSEILLGIYDDSLYSQRLDLRQKEKDVELKKREYENLNNILKHTGNSTNIAAVQKDLASNRSELEKIENSIIELKNTPVVRTTKNTELDSEKIRSELSGIKRQVSTQQAEINQYDIEIADSRQFIGTLEKRITELNNSLLTRQILGELPLTHCPQCLSPLNAHIEEGHCLLCKQPLEEEAEKANAKRLLQEMELQVRESKSLLEEKEHKYTSLVSDLPSYIEKARFLQKQLDSLLNNPQTTRDERIDNLLVAKGAAENKIENLLQQIKIVELIELLQREIAQLTTDISNLRMDITQKEEQQRNKYQLALQKIKEITLYILKNDLDRQDEFRTGKKIEIDFLRDTYSLDGNNNFSASSKTYFKNAILFAIFFASLELDFFRYPRFILCDNMEDKGMEKERTQNFQELITRLSEAHAAVEHQIIFTTSMVSDNLNNQPYCVGEEYTRDNKTLKV